MVMATHNPEPVVRDMDRVLNVHVGPCLKCRRPTRLFFGKRYCDDCAESGWAEYELRTAKVELLAECERNGWLTPDVLRARFDRSVPQFENKGVYTDAKAWHVCKTNVYIHGDIGCGKSYLGMCLLNKAYDEGKSIGKVTSLEFVKACGSGFQSKGIAWLYGPKALMIDDVDKAPWNPTTLGWLWQLIDTRRNLANATILTSNLTVTQLVDTLRDYVPRNASLPSAIMDRMRPVTEYWLNGVSLRKWQRTLGDTAIIETGERLPDFDEPGDTTLEEALF